MNRACFAVCLLLACSVAVRAEEAFPVSGEVRIDAPQVVFENKADLKPVGDRIRVASYNVENFDDGINDGPDVTPELAANHARLAAADLDEIDADVALIIEIEDGAALKLLNEALKKPFPAGYITEFGDDTPEEQKLNLAVLTRIPLAETRELDFSPLEGAGRPPRGSFELQVDLGGNHRLVVYLMHLKSNFGYRPRNMYQRRHALQIVVRDAKQLLKEQPDVRWELMVIGDMNVDPEGKEFARDWSLSPLRGWKDLWRGRPIHERTTLATRYGDPALEFPPVCFDRVYVWADLTNFPWRASDPGVVQKGTNTRDVKVLPGQDGHASDHYPIYLDILKEGPQAP